jgi:hypothetical protein
MRNADTGFNVWDSHGNTELCRKNMEILLDLKNHLPEAARRASVSFNLDIHGGHYHSV